MLILDQGAYKTHVAEESIKCSSCGNVIKPGEYVKFTVSSPWCLHCDIVWVKNWGGVGHELSRITASLDAWKKHIRKRKLQKIKEVHDDTERS